jgi:dTDP-glucose 4,6-dehydratase
LTILITGGAGFIGSNFVRHFLSCTAQDAQEQVIILDKLTYAGNTESLADCLHTSGRSVELICDDIGDTKKVPELLLQYKPRAIINFAAESHVDKSIQAPEEFIQTNIVGTYRLLHMAHDWWEQQNNMFKQDFRFLHISTDEVYGSLTEDELPFSETNRFAPNSPYSASKAASDHLVRAYYHTYGLPVLTINSSNNYGPYQFPEKLIPVMILNALSGKNLPVYGDGLNIRDWMHVTDHCQAISRVLAHGQVGETYNVGGNNCLKNIDVVTMICNILDEVKPRADGVSYTTLIKYVADRKGHDRRYSLDTTKISQELGWKPQYDFITGLRQTVNWYLNNPDWVKAAQDASRSRGYF